MSNSQEQQTNDPVRETQAPQEQSAHTQTTPAGLNIVTGAFGYAGRYIAQALLERGQRVETITNRTREEVDQDEMVNWDSVQPRPYQFQHPGKLSHTLQDCDTLYNTYWVRLAQDPLEFTQALRNSQLLIDAARAAGVRRFVHISTLNPQGSSELPHFRSKALVEQHLRESGLSYAIVRPGLIFGKDDLFLNNLAWMIRHSPVFAVPGDGEYRVQPIEAQEFAALAIQAGEEPDNQTVDAAGPEVHTFNEILELLAQHVQKKPRTVHLSHPNAQRFNQTIGRFMPDMPLGPQEAYNLASDLLVSDQTPKAQVEISRWLTSNKFRMGLVQTYQPARTRKN